MRKVKKKLRRLKRRNKSAYATSVAQWRNFRVISRNRSKRQFFKSDSIAKRVRYTSQFIKKHYPLPFQRKYKQGFPALVRGPTTSLTKHFRRRAHSSRFKYKERRKFNTLDKGHNQVVDNLKYNQWPAGYYSLF